jgi:HK97 gp10 family phage protein
VPATVEGVEAAQDAYRGLAADMRELADVHAAIAEAGEAAARAKAPVGRTGRLSGSIVTSSDSRSATLAVGVDYWPYQEFGTRYIRARKFMAAGIRAMRRTGGGAYRAKLSDAWKGRAKNARAARKREKAAKG